MLAAVVAALASAAFFAAGSSLQHRVVEEAPAAGALSMVTTLVRRPGWLLGAGLSALAFGLHATALRLGDLSVVQPVIVSGIVFAVILRAAIDRRMPSRAEVGWAGLTWVGLALFLFVVKSGAPHQPDGLAALVVTLVGVLLAAALVQVANRLDHPTRRGVLLGCASGLLFGLIAGLLKMATMRLGQGVGHLLWQWPLWALLAVGAWAVFLNQRSYQATRLSVSVPVLNIVQVLVALGFGFVVFAERLFSSPVDRAVEFVALAVMGTGVVRLAGRAEREPEQELVGSGEGRQ